MSFTTSIAQNPKLTRVNPIVETSQYIRGTENGHYYLLSTVTPRGVVGFRPLSKNYAAIGEKPTGEQTRVRVVLENGVNPSVVALLKRFGFSLKTTGGSDHYSHVTTGAAGLIADAVLALSV